MKKFLILLLIPLFAASASGKIFEKSDKMITEERTVHNFTGVDLRCNGEMTLIQGDKESLIIEAPADIMPDIESEVRDRMLILELKKTSLFGLHKRNFDIKFTLTMKEIETTNISGSGSIEAKDIVAKDLAINIDGSGELSFGHLKADKLDVDLSGSGDFDIEDFTGGKISVTISGSGEGEISGKVDEQTIQISGSGDYTAGRLDSKTAEIDISGSGDTELKVSDELKVNVSGSGDVVYLGQPKIRSRVSGSGDVRQKGSW